MRSRGMLIVSLLVFTCACQPSGNTKDTANKAVNAQQIVNTNVNANTNATDLELLRANNETKVEITIKNAGTGNCSIEDLSSDDDSVSLKKNKGKIRWVIYNDCAAAREIVIDEFGKNYPATMRSPFGSNACDNSFIFDAIAPGEEGRLISKTGKKEGTYKYSIRVKLASGGEVKKDPQVEIVAAL